MTRPTDLTLAGARGLLDRGEISAVELVRAHLEAVEAARPLNVYVTETPERALAGAAAADARRKAGTARPLDGIPVAVKDLFCTEGVRTTAGSRMLENFVPGYESTVTARLAAAGAVTVGKTGLDEFAMGSSNETSHFGPVVNPWTRPADGARLVPGGSSGGSAAAVAARTCLGAVGTDTGGSIRQPAAFCGVVGVKPSYGRCSRRGIVAFASSLDQAGPLARSVRDAAILLGAMAGFDPGDSTSSDAPVPDLEAGLEDGVAGLRVGVPRQYALDDAPGRVDALWRRGVAWLRDAGAEPVEVDLAHTRYALPAYYIVAPAEASSNLARYDGVRYGLRVEGEDVDAMYRATRAAGFGAEVQRRILIGTYVLSAGYYDAYYLKAQKVRTLVAGDFDRAFEDCDFLLAPTCPFEAFAIGEKAGDPLAMYRNDVLTVPASLAGLPAISVPAGLSESGLPLGLQVIGRAFDEATLFRAARAVEKAAGFDARPPPPGAGRGGG